MIVSLLKSLIVPIVISLSPPSSTYIASENSNSVPVLEIIKVYGTLAGRECFGRQAPMGSSCQIPLSYLEEELELLNNDNGDAMITREGFRNVLSKKLTFQWPLKPYGVSDSKTLSKTVLMNKGAETYLYMDQLERRGLYDRRNPSGPLPTSLRPQLNDELMREGLNIDALNVVFDALVKNQNNDSSDGEREKDMLTKKDLERIYEKIQNDGNGIGDVNDKALDYYGFINLIGAEKINWPNY